MSKYISIAEEAHGVIGKHFGNQMPSDISRLSRLANWDLYHGPITEPDDGEPWPGFVKATEQLTEWADENLSEAWYDIQFGEVLLSEPEGYYDEDDVNDETGEAHWVEPHWEDFIHFELDDVKRVVFGKELAAYI